MNADLFNFVAGLADDRLVLGHRLSEWCGHAPILEEDIALANIALDLIGQAQNFLKLAGDIEGAGRNEDQLAYFRDPAQFLNLQLVEQPNGDFAFTIARQAIFDCWSVYLLEALSSSSHQELAALCVRAAKEDRYHWKHSSTWVQRLGDGTAESHQRMQSAFDALWSFTPELFQATAAQQKLVAAGLIPNLSSLESQWRKAMNELLEMATLKVPTVGAAAGRPARSQHTAHLAPMLSEMQGLARAFPGAAW
ncbi:MAG: phenylacetate-CoA oxygenase subunit PaaC [Oligoflexia bacterium]|nr:phenylacetate-CoA oxygenase subunit PaaC [Oligoflexia bacterium]